MFCSGHLCLRGGQILSSSFVYSFGSTVEAASKPTIGVTPRELKKDRQYESSDLYARAHHLIYGKKGPLGPDGRVRVAVVITGSESLVVENRVKNQIYGQLREKFPRESFAVMKGTDVNTYLLQKSEEEIYDMQKGRATKSDDGKVNVAQVTNDVDGMPVGVRPRGLADMRLEEYVQAGKQFDYDYVFVMTLSLGELRMYNHNFIIFSTHSSKQNVWVRARLVDVKSGKYLYRNDVVATGTAHNNMLNGRLYERSVKNAVQEIMDDIMVNDD
ncbi:hypothetical protein [Selenomonas ruminantium]|uniref:Putative lipoprotein n=1 Tax=Selenomonas ruminantium TaxID=971 RepID=A0A1K1NJS1_SELRU|nr:hypothetical protein [Selenomonas ruminantium]SFW34670.1 Putative lipoprotein [Selenomonas ruminantium]